MIKNTLFALSCLLAVAAIGCHLLWLGACGRSMTNLAQVAALPPAERQAALETARAQSDRILAVGAVYARLGLASAGAAVLVAIGVRVAWPTATHFWNTRITRALPFAILIFYVLLLFVMV